MHPSRRRKKRPNYGIRTVEVLRGSNGFGFTISGQQPCILSCIVANSPADHAGLRAGDFLISVNGISVSKITHDAVVNLIGNCVGPIRMTIAENYYSDSSEEELDVSRMMGARKPKYMHKPRTHRCYKQSPSENTKKHNENIKYNDENSGNLLNISNQMSVEDEAGPVEYKALVGYLGTIEMPKQLLPNSRLQTVCSCIRKLRQEKRAPTAVLMTIFPTCLTLKNSSNHILAIYPTNRVVYIGSTADRESRYFGLVTSAVSDMRSTENLRHFQWLDDKKFNNTEPEIEISNSCHVFMIDPKIVDHSVHAKKADTFKFTCTADVITGSCLEFPRNALYIVNLVQTMYKLQNNESPKNDEASLGPLVANSPQPSASSNSDSGIGFRDDCGNISDRILVVEFPTHRPFPVVSATNNRPSGIDASSIPLESLDLPLNNEISNKIQDIKSKQLNNLNNIRACGSVNIKNVLGKNDNYFLTKQNNDGDIYNRLTCRAMLDRPLRVTRGLSPTSSDDNTKVPESKSSETLSVSEDVDFQSSVDNISTHSSKSDLKGIFKAPSMFLFESKKLKRQNKMVNSCDNLDKFEENIMNYKLSPKVYGLSKPNHSCEELNNFDTVEKYGYGSLQELCRWNEQGKMRNIAQSEPDVRMQRNGMECEKNGPKESEGPAGWASSFEKLLEDPLGLHTFAEFLKKEFSAENIYFWTACERYRRFPAGPARVAEAQKIYQQHLSVGAPEGVNVDSHGRHCTEQALQEASETLFDQAQKQIFNLMKFDSYPRFLKSSLYKQSLAGELEKPQIDSGLLLQPLTPTKLKKSLSNAEDRRRKSLLPWHRKNRSKSKDRGESEYCQKRSDIVTSCESVNGKLGGGSDTYSSKSSLTSLDLAITSTQDLSKGSQDETSSTVARGPLCRVVLSNGSTTVVQIKTTESIQQLVTRLLDKRGIVYSAFEVYTNKHQKALDVSEPSMKLAGCEVTIEQRVIFKLDLPNKKVISVKSKCTKIIAEVLRPILQKYNYNLDHAKVTIGDTEAVDIHLSVTSIDDKRLRITYCEKTAPTNPVIKVNNVKAKLDEITNQVFEDILQEKADSAFLKAKSDKGSVKSEDWGSEHSSGIFGRFLRRDSGLHDRKKKSLMKIKPPGSSDDVTGEQVKKPLIAKWKTGVNKLQVACSESDELVEGLTRAQRSRLEDQRGTEINFELPDFLKDKNSRFYVENGDLRRNNYENRNIIPKDFNNLTNNNNNNSFTNHNQKLNNLRIYSPNKFSSDESSPSKSLENTVIENKKDSLKCEPPPLPPKPKIVPIKPPNWGQNGYYKKELGASDKKMYLEQPSSSFV
ncbi:regulator of G-protein signaling loco [Tribolium madens]|uniref:regulator of G-protein signaling loco n=1 Tax=Tribolium madens TaxID=41895 RepID=UPI001CF71DAA|nr:regulator of G-protein signaling loco [Tribolium madens]